MGRQLTPITANNREERFVEVQDYIANEMGWTSASKLASEWHNYFLTEQWHEDGLIVGHYDNPTINIIKTTLRQRIENPFNSVCNNLKHNDSNRMSFAVWLTNEGSDGYCFHPMQATPASEYARDAYLLHRGSDYFLYDESLYIDKLGVNQRELLIEIIDKEMSCSDWGSIYLCKMASELLS